MAAAGPVPAAGDRGEPSVAAFSVGSEGGLQKITGELHEYATVKYLARM